jgi:hypothetical protein
VSPHLSYTYTTHVSYRKSSARSNKRRAVNPPPSDTAPKTQKTTLSDDAPSSSRKKGKSKKKSKRKNPAQARKTDVPDGWSSTIVRFYPTGRSVYSFVNSEISLSSSSDPLASSSAQRNSKRPLRRAAGSVQFAVCIVPAPARSSKRTISCPIGLGGHRPGFSVCQAGALCYRCGTRRGFGA